MQSVQITKFSKNNQIFYAFDASNEKVLQNF